MGYSIKGSGRFSAGAFQSYPPNNQMIKNLLFDLGGVIIDIKRQDCVDAFEAIGLKNADSYFGLYSQEGIFKAIEDGSLDVNGFHRAMHEKLPADVTDSQIDDAFQRFITGIPVRRLEALRHLRDKGFRLYLLSNTNPVMWNDIIAKEFRKEGREREDYFDGIVTSFTAKALKPSPEIFEYTCRTLGIRPEETLFFDDSAANTRAAAALGFATATVEPGTEFTDYLPAE